MKYVYIDTETGGLDPQSNGLTEVGAIAFNWDEKKLIATQESSIQFHIKPQKNLSYTPYALSIQGQTLEDLKEIGMGEHDAWKKLAVWMYEQLGRDWRNNPRVMAHFAQFDHGFITALARRQMEKGITSRDTRCSWFCTKALWGQMMALGMHTCSRSSLQSIATYYGITPEDAHTALDDANTGILCFEQMMRTMAAYFKKG